MASQTIDYDALAKQHGAISSTPPPQASGGIDYDALAKQHGAIASTPPPALKEPEGSAAGRFVGNLVSNSPLGMLTGKTARVMVDLAHHAFNGNLPYSPETQEMLGGMVQSHIDQAQKAKAALDRGDKMEAFGHSLATLVPMLGPAAAAAGEKIGGEPGKTDKYGNVTQQGEAPDIAGGVGAGLGVISNVFAPDAVKPARKVAAKIPGAVARAVVPKLESTLNPVEQGAVDFARREGVPLTPGTITGNKFVKALQATTQNSPLGAQTAAEFNRGTEAGVQRVAGKLADEAHPEPVTPESVGRAIPAKLQKTINDLGQQADAHYEKAWQGRDDPQHTYNMPVGMKDTPFLDEAGRPTGESEQRPVMKPVNMPVDVRDIKAQAKPLYDEMQWMPASDRAASAGYQAVKNILEGDDFIPAWQAEKGLGGLKTLARTDSLSGVRNTSQGIAAGMIPNLQDAVNAAVANTGDEAIRGLQQGRATHARMMGVADLADQLRDEPVQNFGKLTWQGDTGIDFLRKIQEQAPEHMAPLGRAFVQQMIDKATEGGGFNKTQNLLNRWNALGDATKEILYPDPQLRQNLGKFFKAADMVAQNPNPSGTALVQSAVSISPLRWAAGYLGSKLFFTPEGISLLTDAVKPQSPGSAALMRAKVRAAAGPGAPPEEPPPQPGGPKTPPPAGPGGAPGNPTPVNPGAAALDTASRRAQETIASSKAKLTGTPKPAETPAPEPGILEAANKAKLTGQPATPGEPPATGLGRISDTLQDKADAALERMRQRGTFDGSKLNAAVPVDDLADMAIWGAAKIAKGTVDFAKWSKEMVADAGEQIKPHLENLYTKAQKIYASHIDTTAGQLPNTRELLKRAKVGAAGKEWYTKTQQELEDTFGKDDGQMMVKFLAATSPNNTVAGNVSQALKAYRQWRTGQPFEGFLPLHADYLNKIAAGEKFGKLKVDSFVRNLSGETEPVTVDRWIARAFKFPTDQPTPGQYKFMDYTLTQIAKRNGLEPRQLQAMIWTAVKEASERGATTTSLPFEALLPKKIAADPQMQILIQNAKAGAQVPARP